MKSYNQSGRGNLNVPIFAGDNEVSSVYCMQIHSGLTKL